MSEEREAEAVETAIVKAETQEVVARPARRAGPDASAMALVPTNIQEAAYTAGLLAQSGMFKHKTREQAFAALMIGRELGLPPAAAMRAIDIIDGKPAPSADALVAACLRRPDICEYFYCVEDDEMHSLWATRRAGQPERRMAFTLEEAKQAGLTSKDVWKKYGKRMMGHRAASFLAREVYPDIVLGMYSEEEVAEIAEEEAARKKHSRLHVVATAAVVAAGTNADLSAEMDLRSVVINRLRATGAPEGPDQAEFEALVAEAKQLAERDPAHRAPLASALKFARDRMKSTTTTEAE